MTSAPRAAAHLCQRAARPYGPPVVFKMRFFLVLFQLVDPALLLVILFAHGCVAMNVVPSGNKLSGR